MLGYETTIQLLVICVAFNLNDDAALDEVTRRVVIHGKVIEVPLFGGGSGELIAGRSRTPSRDVQK